MNMTALGAIIGAVVALLVAIFLAPLIPSPGGTIVAVICYVVAAILLIIAVLRLVQGGGRTRV